MERVYNILKATPEADAPILKFSTAIPQPVLPAVYTLDAFCPPVGDQGQEGACGGWTAVENKYIIRNRWAQSLRLPLSDLTTQFSARDIYWRARKRMGDTADDTGVDNSALAQALVLDGCCTAKDEPYTDTSYAQAPTEQQNVEAAQNKMGAYHFVLNVDDVKTVLCSGYPIICGVNLYSSFESDSTAASGIVPFPVKGEQIIGGHDMTLMGYDMQTVHNGKRGWFKLLNHWGTEWGTVGGPTKERGYCWMHEDLISRAQLDLCVVHYGHAW